LLERHGRGQTINGVDLWNLKLMKEAPSIGRD
jgi:hypothetical protein